MIVSSSPLARGQAEFLLWTGGPLESVCGHSPDPGVSVKASSGPLENARASYFIFQTLRTSQFQTFFATSMTSLSFSHCSSSVSRLPSAVDANPH